MQKKYLKVLKSKITTINLTKFFTVFHLKIINDASNCIIRKNFLR